MVLALMAPKSNLSNAERAERRRAAQLRYNIKRGHTAAKDSSNRLPISQSATPVFGTENFELGKAYRSLFALAFHSPHVIVL
jgi:hypothetical protein